jgi:hypothetical protein
LYPPAWELDDELVSRGRPDEIRPLGVFCRDMDELASVRSSRKGETTNHRFGG